MKNEPIEVRLWSKIDKRGPNQCWFWNAATLPDGYGVIVYNGMLTAAHRVAYILTYGPIKEAYDNRNVIRTCKERLCCNPRHMTLGSLREACAVLGIRKYDMRRGVRRLSKRQKVRIKQRALNGETALRITRSYKDICYRTVLRYVREAIRNE